MKNDESERINVCTKEEKAVVHETVLEQTIVISKLKDYFIEQYSTIDWIFPNNVLQTILLAYNFYRAMYTDTLSLLFDF